MGLRKVILVDQQDNVIGSEEKLKTHKEGLLHRAFSVFLFNSNGKMLLQKRAAFKYHSAGLWSNACCSHPAPSESTVDAALKRTKEEIGINITKLDSLFTFTYRTVFENGLIEHELDHILMGRTNDIPQLNRDEASDWKYIDLQTLTNEVKEKPEDFTFWFKATFVKVYQHYNQRQIRTKRFK